MSEEMEKNENSGFYLNSRFSIWLLTLDVSIVQNAKTQYGRLLLADNFLCIALCEALRKANLDVTLIREGDEILKSFLRRQGANYFANF